MDKSIMELKENEMNKIYKEYNNPEPLSLLVGFPLTCPPKTDPIFKLGLGYNEKDIKGGKET